MSDDTPWYAIDEWQPHGVRVLPEDARLLEQLHRWVRGNRIIDGLPHVTRSEAAADIDTDASGYLRITYGDDYRPSVSVYARQAYTDYEVGISGASSFTAALEDCIGMAASYERDEMLDLALPGLA